MQTTNRPRGVGMNSPTPTEVLALRVRSGLTQAKFGALVHTAERTVRAWEAGSRNCPAQTWELLQLKILAAAGISQPKQP